MRLNLDIYYTIANVNENFFIIPDTLRNFFYNNFSDYLYVSNSSKSNIAKFKTFKEYAKIIFSNRIKYLEHLDLKNCSNSKDIREYNKNLVLCLEDLK